MVLNLRREKGLKRLLYITLFVLVLSTLVQAAPERSDGSIFSTILDSLFPSASGKGLGVTINSNNNGNGIGSIDTECRDLGFDFGVAKWQCNEGDIWTLDVEH